MGAIQSIKDTVGDIEKRIFGLEKRKKTKEPEQIVLELARILQINLSNFQTEKLNKWGVLFREIKRRLREIVQMLEFYREENEKLKKENEGLRRKVLELKKQNQMLEENNKELFEKAKAVFMNKQE